MNDAVKVVLGFLGGMLTLLVLFGLLTMTGLFDMGLMMQGFGSGPGGMMGSGFGSWWILIPILFWVGLLLVIVWALTRSFPVNRSGDIDEHRDPTEELEELLRQSFARGEIDRDEYEQCLEALRGDASPRARMR